MKTHRMYRKHYRITLKSGVNRIPIEILHYNGLLPRSESRLVEDEQPTIGTPEEAYAVALSLSDAEIERLG